MLLTHHLRQLKLPTVLREYEKVALEAARDGQDHVRYLLRLVELELIDRERRMVERRIRAARFPAIKRGSAQGLLFCVRELGRIANIHDITPPPQVY